MLAIIIFLIVSLIAFGVGTKLLRLLRLAPAAPATTGKKAAVIPLSMTLGEEFVFATALGLGLIAYLVFFLGLVKGLYIWIVAPVLLALAVLGWKEIARLLNDTLHGLERSIRVTILFTSIGLGMCLFLMANIMLVGAMAPVAGLEWDGLAYHLAVPKLYLQQHSIFAIPWMSHSNFPSVTEMLYLLGLMLNGQALAKLFHFGFAALTAMAIFHWGNNAFGKRTGLLAAALFISVPLVFWESTVAYNELSFTLFCLLAIWAWWKRTAGRPEGWTLLSGIFAGLALGTKMLAGFLVIFMIGAILWRKREQTDEAAPEAAPATPAWRLLALWLVPALVIAAPWYLRSYIWTGNPVYPFFYGILGGSYWSADLAQQYAVAQANFGLGHGIQWLLALPWTLTMYGRYFYDQPEPAGLFNMLVAVIGPLFLAFLPAMIIRAKKDPTMRYLLAFCGVATVAWFLLSAQTNRYLMPILPVLALGAAAVIIQLSGQSRIMNRVVGCAVGLELILGLAVSITLFGPQVAAGTGFQTQESYLSGNLNLYPIVRRINTELPKTANIMLMGETRGFYLDRNYMWGIGNHNLITPQETETPETLYAAFRRLGVTHLLFAPASHQALTSGGDPLNKSLQALVTQEKLGSVMAERGFAVLALK